MMPSRSDDLYRESLELTPGGVSSPVRAFRPHPLFMESGEGCMIRDAEGRTYVDMCMAYGPLITGHACDRVLRAATERISKGTVFGAPSEPELKLIKRLCRDVPSMDMVRLAVSGTEATMHALRLARGFTGKNGVVKVEGGFHGAHDAVLVRAGSGSSEGVPGSAGVPADAVRNTHLTEYNDTEMLSSLLESRDDIACVIMEPVLGNVGVVPPVKGYLQDVRRITEENGVLLIFDEVITGCRLSAGGAQKVFGVTPDLTTMAKVIGGGFPIGAFGGRRDIMEHVAPSGPVYAAGTFSGNPVSASAGLAQIEVMSEDGNYGRIDRNAEELASRMSDSLADRGARGCVQRAGSMLSVFFGRDSVTNGSEAQGADRTMFGRMFEHMLDEGVYLPPSALETWFVSTAHDGDSIDKVASEFDAFLCKVRV
ncbi:MAG: glutamate-1-semialdehyde 2,1-aminomutase [Candidatus Methanomethylophilaceae archaeon]|nr:glutamate-1-semialdehyde 2,1-aminomutase [Candidatus Methanomethylophilaceae archaeon]NLF33944.1 glutamate-1-semialdehyde 2,1-aminomutase [Thermoplasmatales archaeon]